MPSTHRFGRFALLPDERLLLADGEPVKLGARAFDVLLALVEHRDRMVTKDELIDRVWPGLVVEENNLQVQISALRKALGPQAISTIPGRGYRLTLPMGAAVPAPDAPAHRAVPAAAGAQDAQDGWADAQAKADLAEPTAAPAPAAIGAAAADEFSPLVTLSRPTRERRVALVAAFLGVLVLTGVAFFALRLGAPAESIRSVAVLPFENATGDPANDYLSDGISVSLINRLSGLDGLRVISRRSAFSFKGKKADLAEIGRKLGVDALVVGTLNQRGSTLAITAELVRLADSTQLWGDKYSRSADDVLQVEGEIATTIALSLRRRLSGDERARLARSATSDPQAYRLYLKGRDLARGSQQEMDRSIELLQQAVARSPDYALAYAGLAETHTRQAFHRASARAEPLDKARAAVNRALSLDPDLAEAHNALAMIRFHFDWDWRGADTEFRRALELDPGSSAVHEEYGFFLMAMGRDDDALAQTTEASRLDPLSIGPLHDLAINAFFRGDFAKASAGFRHAIAVDPNWTWGYIKLGLSLARQKQCPEALAQAAIGEQRLASGAAPLARSWVAATFAACGETVRARKILDVLQDLSKKQYVDPVVLAQIQAPLGDVDQAIASYQKAYDDRSPTMVYALMIARDPAMSGKPRYEAIVDRMEFPQRASK